MEQLLEVALSAERKNLFVNRLGFSIHKDDKVIVRLDRGEDYGVVLQEGVILSRKACLGCIGEISRVASEEDILKVDENKKIEEEAFITCENKVLEHNLEMLLVDTEIQFDRSKIIFYFSAENRVDFRNLVKDLAEIFKTRIEMRQIGAREEARHFGGYGSCGKELCCTTWLVSRFEPVTLKMAKDQNTISSPLKMTGLCGRLKCCLKYEQDFYEDVLQRIPKVGAKVRVKNTLVEVERVDIFREFVFVKDEEGNIKRFHLQEIEKK